MRKAPAQGKIDLTPPGQWIKWAGHYKTWWYSFQNFRLLGSTSTCTGERINTAIQAGKAMYQMPRVFAEFERAMIQERIRVECNAPRRKASSLTGRD